MSGSGEDISPDIAILLGRVSRSPRLSSEDALRPSRQAVCAGYGLARDRAAARALDRARRRPLVVDLLWHLPTSVVDRRAAPPIRELNPSDWPDAVVTLKIRVERHEPGFGRRPYRLHCTDGTGTLTLVYFSARGDQLQRLLPVGAERIVSGTVDYYSGRPQMAHPDYVV